MTRSSRRTARSARLLALPALAALLVSGCGQGPVRTGAAASIGDTTISQSTLQQVVARGLADPQAQQQVGDRVSFQRTVLSRLITGDLLRAAARSKGVSVTSGEVDARTAALATQLGGEQQLETQAAQSGIAKQDLRPFISDLALNDKLADSLVADQQVPATQLAALYQKDIAQYDKVTARHILLKTRAEAEQVLAEVTADPSKFAAIAAVRSLDTGSKAQGGQLAPAGRGAYVKPFEDALFAGKPGQYGIVQTEFGFHVYQVQERQTTTLAQATPALRRQVLQAQREQAVGALLRKTAADRRITVNPRFGRWDSTTGTVVDTAASGPGVVSSPEAGEGATAAPTTAEGSGGDPSPEVVTPEQPSASPAP